MRTQEQNLDHRTLHMFSDPDKKKYPGEKNRETYWKPIDNNRNLSDKTIKKSLE